MNQKISSYQWLIITTAILLIPLLYIHQVAHTINPFYLNGKQFLPFFGLLTVTSFVTGFIGVLLSKKQKADNRAVINYQLFQPKHCVGFVLLIGFARFIQGISNHKPVGYLILLLLLNVGIYKLLRLFRQAA